MTAPDLPFWMRLFARLAVEAACVVGIALLLERLIRPAFWRRALWQSAIVCLLLLTASELSGFGRGIASFLFGHTRLERKLVVRTSPVEAAALPLLLPRPQTSFAPAPVTAALPMVKPEIVQPVWWPGLLWLAGGLVILGRVVVAQVLFISLRRRRINLIHSDLNNRVAAILERLAVRRKICLLQSPGLTSPIAFGVLRPSVSLPMDFAVKFSPAEQDAMLAHELAHLASRDPLWYLLADVGSAALWWHPQSWWARRRLHRASELAADEAATIFPEGPAALAGCLVTLGKQMVQFPGASLIGVEGSGLRSNLADRVQRLLRLADTARQPSYGWRAHAAKLGAIITISATAIGLSGCLQNRDPVKQPTLQANLSQSWNTSPASTVWHSALPARTTEPPAPKPITALPVKLDLGGVEAGQPGSPPLPNPNPDSSKGSQTIVRKLQGIKLKELPAGFEQGLPLSEVLNILAKISITNDLGRTGVNFLFNPRVGGNAAGEVVDSATITIKITPSLKNVNLLQLLDAIRQMADQPVDFSVSDYAVWFFVKPPATAALENKIQPFLDPNTDTSQDREVIISRLQNIKLKELPAGFEQGLPLSEVLNILAKISITNDLGRTGVNFLFNPRVGGNATGGIVDSASITIKITPPLKNVNLLQLLDAINQMADPPVDFSVTDYAVWFFVKRPEAATPETRLSPVPNSNPSTNEQKDVVAAMVKEGKLLYETGKLDDAEKQLSQALKLDPSNTAAAYYLDRLKYDRLIRTNGTNREVGLVPWVPSPYQQNQPVTINNSINQREGRKTIMRKLQEIKVSELPDSFEQGVPFTEALRTIRKISISNDLENIGINFMYDPRVGGPAGATPDPAAPAPVQVDAGNITVKISPPLINLTLTQMLDAICQLADHPINYRIEDYAVVFFVKPPETPLLATRMFHVDPHTFLQGLKGFNITTTNGAVTDNVMVTRYFGSMGVNLTNNGAYAFFNYRTGDILVRATEQDLDTVERVIELLNKVPPQLQIDVKFASVPQAGTNRSGFNWYLGNFTNTIGATSGKVPAVRRPANPANPSGIFPAAQNGPSPPPPSTNLSALTNPTAITGILTDPQFRMVIQAIEQRDGADILSAPRVTTENGRQTHVAVSDIVDIVTAATSPGTNTNPFTQGPALDIVPTISADGYSIQLVVNYTNVTFLGYDNPGVPPAHMPVPRYSKWVVTNTITVWDGQTVMLSQLAQASDQKQSTNTPWQNLLIFITPTIIDPAGNRLHTDDEMPMADKTVPPQPPGTPFPK